MIYRSRSHSYRELPLRMAELGSMFRSELSGVLGGLTRVRAIQLDDAHIFCTLDQVADEAAAALEMIRDAYAALGIAPARYRLSLPGPGGKYAAAPAQWRRSAALPAEVLDRSGLPCEQAEGEAAFYGPKIDVQVTDAAGREFTLSPPGWPPPSWRSSPSPVTSGRRPRSSPAGATASASGPRSPTPGPVRWGPGCERPGWCRTRPSSARRRWPRTGSRFG